MADPTGGALPVHRDHRRSFADNLYVYPVVSRRSKGVSLGVNLNPDKVCNFDCVYCQVDRTVPGAVRTVDEPRLLAELDALLDVVVSGELYEHERFRGTPPALRRLNDIAFSGDGESTSYPRFREVVRGVGELRDRHGLSGVKLVVITNATLFHRPRVREALAEIDRAGGEIWAKLDAGTEEYYRTVERTTIPFRQVLDNITEAARVRPLVIQSLFLRLHGQPPTPEECAAYCGRLNDVVGAGGRIRLVQVYTVARAPAESYVTPLSRTEIDALAALVRERTGLTVEAFYGPD